MFDNHCIIAMNYLCWLSTFSGSSLVSLSSWTNDSGEEYISTNRSVELIVSWNTVLDIIIWYCCIKNGTIKETSNAFHSQTNTWLDASAMNLSARLISLAILYGQLSILIPSQSIEWYPMAASRNSFLSCTSTWQNHV